jgi:hypothetical protein
MTLSAIAELERLLAAIYDARTVQLSFDMWEHYGAQHATDAARAQMHADMDAATTSEAAAVAALETLAAATRATSPHDIVAWCTVHQRFLETFIATSSEPDGVAVCVARDEHAQWADVEAGTRAFAHQNVCYVPQHQASVHKWESS